jgi:hypothetical protein
VRRTPTPPIDKPKKATPARTPAGGERPTTAHAPRVKAARVTRGTGVPPLESSEESNRLSGVNVLLILSLGASTLLLALAAIPPAWTLHFPGFSAHPVAVRNKMAMAGGILLVETCLIALMFAA